MKCEEDALEEAITKTGGRPASTGLVRGKYSLSVGMPETVPPAGWKWIPLSTVARLESGHTPSRRHPEYWGGKIPWIGIRDATANHGTTINDTEQHTSELGIANSSARVLPAGTVCLSRTASVGFVVVMGRPMATSQDFVNWVCSDEIDYRFLKYVLLSEHESMLRFASGTTHQTIYFPEAKAFHVCVPSVVQQQQIVEILQSLDDRIALLRETNDTLEAIAQALFKSWFVDFDPVRAKQEGIVAAGMDDATAVCFPSKTVELLTPASRPAVSELIAAGALLIGDGYRAKNDELGQPGLPFVRAGDLDSGQITPTKDHLSLQVVKVAAMKMAKPGDTAFTSKGTIGRFAFVDDASGEAVYSPQVCFWRSLRPDIIEPAYLHYWMKSAAFKIQVDAVRGQAAIMDYVSLSDQRRMRLDLPAIEVQRRFAEVAGVILHRISCNRATAMHLASLRDTLLPRLISGRLRLPEAEAALAET